MTPISNRREKNPETNFSFSKNLKDKKFDTKTQKLKENALTLVKKYENNKNNLDLDKQNEAVSKIIEAWNQYLQEKERCFDVLIERINSVEQTEKKLNVSLNDSRVHMRSHNLNASLLAVNPRPLSARWKKDHKIWEDKIAKQLNTRDHLSRDKAYFEIELKPLKDSKATFERKMNNARTRIEGYMREQELIQKAIHSKTRPALPTGGMIDTRPTPPLHSLSFNQENNQTPPSRMRIVAEDCNEDTLTQVVDIQMTSLTPRNVYEKIEEKRQDLNNLLIEAARKIKEILELNKFLYGDSEMTRQQEAGLRETLLFDASATLFVNSEI